MPEPTWASSIDWRVRPARRLRVRVGTDSAAVPKVLDELRVGLGEEAHQLRRARGLAKATEHPAVEVLRRAGALGIRSVGRQEVARRRGRPHV